MSKRSAVRILIAALMIIVVLGIMPNTTQNFAILDWGNIPEWIGAVGTSGAVIVALFIALSDERRRANRERREQAEKIGVWKTHQNDGGSAKSIEQSTIHVNNTSHLPIYDVVISYGSAYGSGAKYAMGDDNQILVLKLPPGLHNIPPRNNPITKKSANHLNEGVAISFRDSNGHFWRRDASGILQETDMHPFDELGIKQPIQPNRWTGFLTE